MKQLLDAASSGDLAEVEKALSAGADVDARGPYGNTALNEAAQFGHTEVVKRLLDAGADLENLGGSQMTPLMNAASRGHFEIVEILLEKGARVTDDLLGIIQTKIGILEENAEGGMVSWDGVQAWKSFQEFLLTQRYKQDVPVFVELLSASKPEQRSAAVRDLSEAARRGLDVSAAASGLEPYLNDPADEIRESANVAMARALAFSGGAGKLPSLLQSDDTRRLTGAIGGIAYAARDGADVSPAIPAIAALLAHQQPELRRWAVLALSFAAAKSDVTSSLPGLVTLLADTDPAVRRSTAAAFSRLARAGVDITSARPALEKLRSDPEEDVREVAERVLQS